MKASVEEEHLKARISPCEAVNANNTASFLKKIVSRVLFPSKIQSFLEDMPLESLNTFGGKKYHLPLYPRKEPQIMIHCLVRNADA